MPEKPRYSWVRIQSRDEQWSLIDENAESGHPLRHIVNFGPYGGDPRPDGFWRLFLDEGHEDYDSRDEAMEAGVASLQR